MEVTEKKVKYIVMRNDKPLSNEELTLEEANQELERWQNVLKRWPDGSKLSIVEVK
jgi:hypothetical protein